MATTMMPSSHGACGCGGGPGHDVCEDSAGLERTRFFARQLVGPADFTQAQRYLREKHRRHNRMLHGWGVVCGAGVSPAAAEAGGPPIPYSVCVAPGYVLGPDGDEILVDTATTFDVRRVADDIRASCPPALDRWCPPVRRDVDPRTTMYLAIRHDERPLRPVQAAPGCGCGTECEYSRVVDGFTLGILDTLPQVYVDEEAGNAPAGRRGELEGTVRCTPQLRESGRPCPPCPASRWVILADLTVALSGAVTVDQYRHRRFVVSFGPYGFSCRSDGGPVPAPPRSTGDERRGGGGEPARIDDRPGRIDRD